MNKILIICLGLSLLMAFCVLISESQRERFVLFLKKKPGRPKLLLFSIFLCCTIVISLSDGWHVGLLMRIAVYFLALATFKLEQDGMNKSPIFWRNAAVSAVVFLFIVCGFVPAHTTRASLGFGLPILMWGTAIYILSTLPLWGKFPLYCDWKLNAHDLKAVLLVFSALFPCIASLGSWSHFINPGFGWFQKNNMAVMPLLFVMILLATALTEELFCRGVVQGMLSSCLQKRRFGTVLSITITSLIFGFGHIRHITRIAGTSTGHFSFPNWWYVFFATIAGLGYGYIYQSRKSLMAAALLHTAVDFFWIVFFRN